eukprot:COSAG02_NODE_43572_length_373_cov_1.160584_1_plen_76_part_10
MREPSEGVIGRAKVALPTLRVKLASCERVILGFGAFLGAYVRRRCAEEGSTQSHIDLFEPRGHMYAYTRIRAYAYL